jgi:hypothetical protein
MKIQEILEKVGKDVMSDETKSAITEAFNSTVESIVKERVDLEIKNVVENINDDHSKKLQTLLETIDKEHTEKLESFYNQITENNTNKLKEVIKKYEGMLSESANEFKDKLISEVSNYIDLCIEKAIPKETFEKAVHNMLANETLDKLRNVLVVNDEVVTKQVTEAVHNAKTTVEDMRKELNEALKENMGLAQSLKQAKAAILLEKKTTGLPQKKRNYITRLLSDKSEGEIEENYQYVVEMFERDEDESTAEVTVKAKEGSVTKTVDTPKSVITEQVVDSATPVESPTGTSEYLNALKKFDRK